MKVGILLTLGLVCASCARPTRPIRTTPRKIDDLVQAAARDHGVHAALVLAVIQVESGFRPHARSRVGARGLMQLMPRTAAAMARYIGRVRYEIDDPAFNVEAGTAYLGLLLRRFGDERLALAAYNAGPARVGRWVRKGRALPSFSRRYVSAVLAARGGFERGERAPEPAPRISRPEYDRTALRELLREKLGESPATLSEKKEEIPGGSEGG